MPDTNINKADTGAFTASDFSVAPISTDGPTGDKETIYTIDRWSEWYGMYKTIPELKISIDAISKWTVGKGFSADPLTKLTLMKIRGHGKDSFNSILSNAIRTYHICGDSFAEIIRDGEGYLINLKPLEPKSMRIVANGKGVIIRYEQFEKLGTVTKILNTFKPEEMFHLSRNRTADEIHGVGMVESVENIILMRNEAMTDYKKLLHRNVYPVRIWHLDTDDETAIAGFKAKVAAAKGEHEDIFIPKGAVETEIASVAPNSSLNPLPWINMLNTYFYQATGVPQVVVGGSQGMTEAAVKIEYMAFEQTTENEQLYVEEQTLMQLNFEINLEFPASIQNDMVTDMGKEESMQAATQEDTSITNTEVTPGVAK